MNINFDVVIPTTLSKTEFKKSSTYKCIEQSVRHSPKNIKGNLVIFYENSKGLSELFQNHLNQTNADYVLFIHDDLEVHDQFLFQKLLLAHQSFDIVGLAGSISQDYTKQSPPAWHLSANGPSDARGVVGHYIPAGLIEAHPAHVNSMYFGPSPSKVVVIDGLFMSFKMSSLKDKPEIFDREFTFHFYDMATCANAQKNNLQIGVWPVYCVHHGLGEFENDQTWKQLSIKFKNKYGNYKI